MLLSCTSLKIFVHIRQEQDLQIKRECLLQDPLMHAGRTAHELLLKTTLDLQNSITRRCGTSYIPGDNNRCRYIYRYHQEVEIIQIQLDRSAREINHNACAEFSIATKSTWEHQDLCCYWQSGPCEALEPMIIG